MWAGRLAGTVLGCGRRCKCKVDGGLDGVAAFVGRLDEKRLNGVDKCGKFGRSDRRKAFRRSGERLRDEDAYVVSERARMRPVGSYIARSDRDVAQERQQWYADPVRNVAGRDSCNKGHR